MLTPIVVFNSKIFVALSFDAHVVNFKDAIDV